MDWECEWSLLGVFFACAHVYVCVCVGLVCIVVVVQIGVYGLGAGMFSLSRGMISSNRRMVIGPFWVSALQCMRARACLCVRERERESIQKMSWCNLRKIVFHILVSNYEFYLKKKGRQTGWAKFLSIFGDRMSYEMLSY